VLPAPRVQDGLTISPSPFRKQADSKAPTNHIPDNGQAERFVQTSMREWAYARAYSTSQHRAAELPIWLHRYHWHRPHGGIGAKPPISRIALTKDNVLRLHN
jgi:transposase InsO family protein